MHTRAADEGGELRRRLSQRGQGGLCRLFRRLQGDQPEQVGQVARQGVFRNQGKRAEEVRLLLLRCRDSCLSLRRLQGDCQREEKDGRDRPSYAHS
ncbi:hypothetical protein SDC9_166560 [bioreactor metagenome]|uniref:Uncharacterized protein n=1 Tax=bioreactor metagenome TaxID=1076179 RepID=A0A645G4X4_9ZZZZ